MPRAVGARIRKLDGRTELPPKGYHVRRRLYGMQHHIEKPISPSRLLHGPFTHAVRPYPT